MAKCPFRCVDEINQVSGGGALCCTWWLYRRWPSVPSDVLTKFTRWVGGGEECRPPCCTGVHQIIGRTQLSDVALFRALQTGICKICLHCRLLREKLRTHRKKWSNCDQKINISQLKMCVLPIPRPYERVGEVAYSHTRHFFQNISMQSLSVIFTGYFDLKNTSFWFTNGKL